MSTISKPAILGGVPVRSAPLSEVHNIDHEEISAVEQVLRKGPLSGYLGTYSEKFLGGEQVRHFEKNFAEKFHVRHAISFNSATTALHAAMVALGVGPGDEVIVPPYSMSATAMAPIMNGAVPIFADIDPDTFCIDPKAIKKVLSKNTKAIIAVNLFGQSANYKEIFSLIDRNKVKIVEDNAQAIGATHHNELTGTIADIGVFSLNVHKHIQAGEGGILVTNDDNLALRAQLSRNHGESVVDQMEDYNLGPIIGSNYRMSELHAAVSNVQLNKLDKLLVSRRQLVEYLESKLKDIDGIKLPVVAEGNTHVYYRYVFKIDSNLLGIDRSTLLRAMEAEGFPLSPGYVKPIYMLPVFQQKQAFNNSSFPFVFELYDGNPDYKSGSCPVVERMYETELTLTDICQFPNTKDNIDEFMKALVRILDFKDEIKSAV